MSRTRFSIRKKALRAAASVALLSAPLACGEAGVEPLEPGRPEAAQIRPGEAVPDQMEDTLIGVVTDGGVAMDSGVACDREQLSSEAYLECCEAIEWDWDQGCAAWGPPAPPAFRGGRLS